MKKNLITVLKKLLKAFGGDDKSVKNNAVDIIDKIADNASSGGSGGGANVLTLYGDAGMLGEESPHLFKNIECTEGYPSVEEANAALLAATSIRVIFVYKDTGSIYRIHFAEEACLANETTGYDYPSVCTMDEEDYYSLYIEKGGSVTPPK